MIISLMGYMGCGKSHIANLLAQKLTYKLIDLDQKIVLDAGMDIPEIFKKQGEIGFRKRERSALNEVLATKSDIILSLGGGTPAYYDNMSAINQATHSVYLRAKIPTLVQRLANEKDSRPMIAHLADEDLAEFVAKHLFERSNFYNQAHYIIDVDSLSAEAIVEELVNTLSLLH